VFVLFPRATVLQTPPAPALQEAGSAFLEPSAAAASVLVLEWLDDVERALKEAAPQVAAIPSGKARNIAPKRLKDIRGRLPAARGMPCE